MLGRKAAQPPHCPTAVTDAPPPVDDDVDDVRQADTLIDRLTEANADVQVKVGNMELCDPPSTDPTEISDYPVISASDCESISISISISTTKINVRPKANIKLT